MLGDDEYGWVVFWKADEEKEVQEGVEEIAWDDFVKIFMDT